ncbi:hypothetical protein EWI31_17965 [Streptomyces tsukubensis]|uniref:Uncharacterized protein n=1 Tax=Streptomyces tsukubensis (strain DSM 42081 / NBRC 108919 / NRRL 18488 / 9993) TaxID=1114943 RepID=A0A7G3UIR8_STRT9|nr:hypothetical protein STSU_018210 [Streptomyces tsukubensis NRRL18488]TAI43627.1 hypothetical protein EWI31_17965 [Streptomyces tsukubensis]
MDVTFTLWVLGGSGVASVALFAAKGLLDQLPGVFDSWHAARRAWRGDPPPRSSELQARPGAGALDRPDVDLGQAPDSRF